jgi:HEPN domain-containing protein
VKDAADLARAWLGKADRDLAAAKLCAGETQTTDAACFHAQQAAEKYLKAYLTASGADFPRTHDLEELARLCQPHAPTLDLGRCDLIGLTEYAVQVRYDLTEVPSLAEARSAVAEAAAVRDAVVAAISREGRPERRP